MTTTEIGPDTEQPRPTGAELAARRKQTRRFDTPSRGKVADELMQHLVDSGLNGQQIVDTLWRDYQIKYTRAGVSAWRTKKGRPARVRSANKEKLIPWRVREDHQQDRLLKFLHTEANIRDGKTIDRSNQFRHASVMHDLLSEGSVVYYDQDNGFHRVAPRPDIDTDLIYDPRFADDGTPITDRSLWQ